MDTSMTISEARDMALSVMEADPESRKEYELYLLRIIKGLQTHRRITEKTSWLMESPEPKHIFMMSRMFQEGKNRAAEDMWKWAQHYLELSGYVVKANPGLMSWSIHYANS
jgi:hypothetical protein